MTHVNATKYLTFSLHPHVCTELECKLKIEMSLPSGSLATLEVYGASSNAREQKSALPINPATGWSFLPLMTGTETVLPSAVVQPLRGTLPDVAVSIRFGDLRHRLDAPWNVQVTQGCGEAILKEVAWQGEGTEIVSNSSFQSALKGGYPSLKK